MGSWSIDHDLSGNLTSPPQGHDPFSDGSKVGTMMTFGPFRVASVLTHEDLEVVCLQYHIPPKFPWPLIGAHRSQ